MYIETSLFGFYYDQKPVNKEKRESVRKLFWQIREGYFETGLVSSITITELSRAPEGIRGKLLSLIKNYQFKEIVVDEDKVEEIAQRYIKKLPVFEEFENDARHIAIATVGGVDVLVTLNCEHIANEQTILEVKEINIKSGYTKELDIRRPEEVIIYEAK